MDGANTAILVALLICGLAAVSESTPERAEAFLMSKLGSLNDDMHAMMGAAASIIPNILAHMKPGFEPHCDLGFTPCSSGECINEEWICDSIMDCDDHRDETECVCAPNQTRCGSGECKNNDYWCNGYVDCYDSSDETGCECSIHERRCGSGECKFLELWCDGYHDCQDRSDEMDCGDINCTESEFQCGGNETRCMHASSWCDGYADCYDGSDEPPNCGEQCTESQFSCGAYCIMKYEVCDGNVDCNTNSLDELHCECNGFQCSDGSCQDFYSKCDGYSNCNDYSDETSCHDTNSRCTESGGFPCDNGRCISSSFHCNHVDECGDNSDEIGCECGSEEFECNDGSCIFEKTVCDFIPDCPDGEDEQSCGSCKMNEHSCIGYTSCYTESQRCDGITDCPHGDDERNCAILISDSMEDKEGRLAAKKSGVLYYGICSDDWTDELSRQACMNMGFGREGLVAETSFVSAEDGPYMKADADISSNGYILQNLKPGDCASGQVVRLSCDRPECGQRPLFSNPAGVTTPYIINGNLAEVGAWPWQVRLNIRGTFNCGGSLLDHHWVLTAAHCVNYDEDFRDTPHLVSLDLGVTDSSLTVDPKSRRYTAHTVLTHPDWTILNLAADVALLYIEDYIEYTDHIQPACLPNSVEQLSEQIECYITGWGALFGDSTIDVHVLRQSKVTTLDEDDCLRVMVWEGESQFDPTEELCVGSLTGFTGACYGDSGGPFVCRDITDTWSVFGIASHLIPGCVSPIMYKTVPHFRPWIDQQMQRAP